MPQIKTHHEWGGGGGGSYLVSHQWQARQVRHTDVQSVEEDVIVNKERETL